MKQLMYLIILILVFFNFFLIYINNKQSKSFHDIFEKEKYRIEYILEENKILKKNEEINRILFNLEYCGFGTNELKLVFRVNYGECGSCLDTLYKKIKLRNVIKNNVVFTTDINDRKKCLIDLNINNFHNSCFYDYFEINPPIMMEELNKSYFYIQNSHANKFLFFLPSHNNPKRTEDYLNFLEKYIFRDN